MRVEEVWAQGHDPAFVAELVGLGCETDAYDPMEQAMLAYCESVGISRDHLFAGELITEYPFTDALKMMGHVWRHDGRLVVAAKGSPESIFAICDMPEDERADGRSPGFGNGPARAAGHRRGRAALRRGGADTAGHHRLPASFSGSRRPCRSARGRLLHRISRSAAARASGS